MVQRWLEHRTHTESSKYRCVCEVKIALTTKYLQFGSTRRVARDTGTDVRPPSHSLPASLSLSASYTLSRVCMHAGGNLYHPKGNPAPNPSVGSNSSRLCPCHAAARRTKKAHKRKKTTPRNPCNRPVSRPVAAQPCWLYRFRPLLFPFAAPPPEPTVSTLAAREVPFGVPFTPLTALFCTEKSAPASLQI